MSTQYIFGDLGENISQIVVNDETQDTAILSHQLGDTAPPFFPDGSFWYSTDVAIIGYGVYVKNPGISTPAFLLDPMHSQLNSGGTVASAANQNAGAFRITNLGASISAGDATRRDEVMMLNGVNAATANLPLGGFRVVGLGAPVDDSDAARKVDISDLSKHPNLQAVSYYQDSRDIRGNGEPVKIANTADPEDLRITRVGNPSEYLFVPRSMTLRFYGHWHTRSGNTDLEVSSLPDEFRVLRFDGDQSRGGVDPGNGGTFQVGFIAKGGDTQYIRLLGNWKYTAGDLGFELFARLESTGEDVILRQAPSSVLNGSVMLHASGGIGI